MKVSIVTVVFNCINYIEDCIKSVLNQDYQNIEYIVIDGGSTDGTISVINKYSDRIAYFMTESDNGMYDALNKGCAVATGDLLGVLNADDLFADIDVISSIVCCFKQNNCDIIYGNLDFIARNDLKKVTRRWRSKPYKSQRIKTGWMPAHPTLYIKREMFVSHGCYSLNFGSCADYELILRYLYKNSAEVVFLDRLIIFMRNGGLSNGSVKKIILAIVNDYKALVYNDIPNPLLVLILKKLRKLNQFFIW